MGGWLAQSGEEETQTHLVTRFRELLAEELRPLIGGIGIYRGDLKAVGDWKDGRLQVTVRDAGAGDDVHVSSLAVDEVWAARIVDALQDMLDGMGLEPKKKGTRLTKHITPRRTR